jgi:hypothetical protein
MVGPKDASLVDDAVKRIVSGLEPDLLSVHSLHWGDRTAGLGLLDSNDLRQVLTHKGTCDVVVVPNRFDVLTYVPPPTPLHANRILTQLLLLPPGLQFQDCISILTSPPPPAHAHTPGTVSSKIASSIITYPPRARCAQTRTRAHLGTVIPGPRSPPTCLHPHVNPSPSPSLSTPSLPPGAVLHKPRPPPTC